MTTIKENSLTISNIYKSRKIILELLKTRVTMSMNGMILVLTKSNQCDQTINWTCF